jgi:hypothetical protein
MVLAGIAAIVLGWVGATDFRGLATRHARMSVGMMAPVARALDRVPPWRWIDLDPEVSLRRQLRLLKVSGVVFIVVGAMFVLGGVATWFGAGS